MFSIDAVFSTMSTFLLDAEKVAAAALVVREAVQAPRTLPALARARTVVDPASLLQLEEPGLAKMRKTAGGNVVSGLAKTT